MTTNSFGKSFNIVSFGESHGPAIGVVIDGCPAGLDFDFDLLQRELDRRKPGQGSLTSSRKEPDEIKILSGIHNDKTLGTPIAMIVENKDVRSEDYKEIASNPRPGHADDVWKSKFGHSDHRGGGRSSGRETAARVMAGAVARMFVCSQYPDLNVKGFVRQIGELRLSDNERQDFLEAKQAYMADDFVLRFPSAAKQNVLQEMVSEAQSKGLSFGGQAEIVVEKPPSGLGQPVFNKLKADLAFAALGIGATSAVEFGAGIAAANSEGTQFHHPQSDQSQYGGIRGGISTGENISYQVTFKPTSSVLDVAKKGRHDPCIVPRAVPVLEAMTWLVLADHVLMSRTDRV